MLLGRVRMLGFHFAKCDGDGRKAEEGWVCSPWFVLPEHPLLPHQTHAGLFSPKTGRSASEVPLPLFAVE